MTYEDAVCALEPVVIALERIATALEQVRDGDLALKRGRYWDKLYEGGTVFTNWITKLQAGDQFDVPAHMVADLRVHARAMGVEFEDRDGVIPESHTVAKVLREVPS